MSGCCADCHFRWEELYVFPELPDWLRTRFESEHEIIRALPKGPKQRAAMRRHAAQEEALLKDHLSADLFREMKRQHAEHEARHG